MKKIYAMIACLLLMACSEPTERIENKLNKYVQEDLKFMVAEKLHDGMDPKVLADTPYYRIKDFRLFDGASSEIYSAYAEVDFFIYRDIGIHEKRKYRYDVHYRHWDRYFKQLNFGKDSLP